MEIIAGIVALVVLGYLVLRRGKPPTPPPSKGAAQALPVKDGDRYRSKYGFGTTAEEDSKNEAARTQRLEAFSSFAPRTYDAILSVLVDYAKATNATSVCFKHSRSSYAWWVRHDQTVHGIHTKHGLVAFVSMNVNPEFGALDSAPPASTRIYVDQTAKQCHELASALVSASEGGLVVLLSWAFDSPPWPIEHTQAEAYETVFQRPGP